MKKTVRKSGEFMILRVGVPLAWTLITLMMAFLQTQFLVDCYNASPILSVLFVSVWFIFGLAFLPFTRSGYTRLSVIILLAAFIFLCGIHGFDLTDKTNAIVGIGAFLGVAIAWAGGAGTMMWRMAQGKVATDDDDT